MSEERTQPDSEVNRCPRCGGVIDLGQGPDEVVCPTCQENALAEADRTQSTLETTHSTLTEATLASPSPSDQSQRDSDTVLFSTRRGSTERGIGGEVQGANGRLLLGDYEILGEIARGGMGVVYKARQISLNRIVALKLLHSLESPTTPRIARFLAEAEAAGQLDHPNIVPIYGAGIQGDNYYFSMKLVEGGTLSDAIRRKLENSGSDGGTREAVQLVAVVARAVHFAHQRGILHRDLKPGNILLELDGQPMVADFGLAKRLDAPTSLTLPGEFLGTPTYMAPEQANGGAHTSTTATDVYALGVILYELITGRPPFRGRTPVEILRHVLEDQPRPARELVPTLSRDIDTICLKCMEKDPNRRYASAEMLAEDLDRWLAGEPVLARRTGRFESMAKWARRRPAPTALIVLIFLLGTIGFPGMLYLWRRAADAADRADRAADQARQAASNESAARRKLEANDYVQRVGLAERDLASNHLARVGSLLDGCPTAMRGWEWGYLRRWSRFGPYRDIGPRERAKAVAWSRDSSRLATSDGRGAVLLWDAAAGGKAPLETLEGHDVITNDTVFFPDGRRLATVGGDHLKIWDLGSARNASGQISTPGRVLGMPQRPVPQGPATQTETPQRRPGCVAIDPAGRRIVVGCNDGFLIVIDAETGAILKTIAAHNIQVYAVAFRPDGQTIGSASYDGTAKLWDVETGAPLTTLSGHSAPVCGIAWDLSGRRVATVSMDSTLRLWDTDSPGSPIVCGGHNAPIFGLAISPDGKRVATASMDKTVRIWDSADGRELLVLRGHTQLVVSVAFSPDGRWLASTGGDGAKLWDSRPPGEADRQDLITYRGHRAMGFRVAYRPDGRLVASVAADGVVRLWDPGTGRDVLSFLQHHQPVFGVAFAPDGQTVASSDASGKLFLWEAETGRVTRELLGEGEVYHVAFSPDGRKLLSAEASGTVRLWDVKSGQQLTRIKHDMEVWSAVFSPDGRRVASASFDGTVLVSDADSGETLRTLRGHSSLIRSVAFHPDSNLIASAGSDATVRLWDLRTGEVVRIDRPGEEMVVVAFSRDGKRMVTGGENGRIQIRSTADGSILNTLRGHTALVHDVRFDPEGRHLLSISWDGTAKVWALPD